MITVVILNWKRPGQVAEIIEHLKPDPLVGQILVMNNSPVRFESPVAEVLQANLDFGLNSRFMAAAFAVETEILFHDDDVILPQPVVAELHRTLMENPNRLVTTQGGLRPTGSAYRLRATPRPGHVDISLTRACMMRREHLPRVLRCMYAFWRDDADRIRKTLNGEDIFLSYAMRSIEGPPIIIELPEPYRNLRQDHAICKRRGFQKQRMELMVRAAGFQWPD